MTTQREGLVTKAEETLRLRDDDSADAMSFWRARACFFAEEILRHGVAAPLDEECMGLMRGLYEIAYYHCTMRPIMDKLNEKLHFKE